MKTVALVPVKDLQTAKSRLGSVVDLPGRRKVVLDLLARGITALQGAPSVGEIWVVSPDDEVLREA
ncbi:MAG TPA: 2-phospho-L-lactate guanylyltransferase, partial [Candidatus Xenobia bacterium]